MEIYGKDSLAYNNIIHNTFRVLEMNTKALCGTI